jgi:tetratricopeptide (TPR) repeat protein
MKRLLCLLSAVALVAVLASDTVYSQIPQSPPLPMLRAPRVSQGAKVTQVIGLSEVTIFYHRPGVKGRVIWGGLLPYGEFWRAGANEPTLFTFSDDVTIEGKKLAAGTYRFGTIPGPKEWTVIFNSEVKNWGTVYEPQYDTLKFTVTPETGPNEEWLSYSFTDLTPSSARVVLAWEKLRIGFTIEFNTLAKMESSVGTWQVLNAAAGYALSQNVYLNEAMNWVDRSIALDRNPRNLQTKADLLAQAGKLDDAIATAEEAVKLAKQRNPKANTSGLEKRIADWKAKK